MTRLFSAKPLLAAAIAFGALAATSVAQARSDLFFSIGFQAPYGYVQPAPVYVQPQPVYVQPQPVYLYREPVYVRPQTYYVQPQPVYYGSRRWHERPGPWGDADRDGVRNIYDRDSRFYDGRAVHRAGGWNDADRDGVPDHHDRAPYNPYRH